MVGRKRWKSEKRKKEKKDKRKEGGKAWREERRGSEVFHHLFSSHALTNVVIRP